MMPPCLYQARNEISDRAVVRIKSSPEFHLLQFSFDIRQAIKKHMSAAPIFRAANPGLVSHCSEAPASSGLGPHGDLLQSASGIFDSEPLLVLRLRRTNVL